MKFLSETRSSVSPVEDLEMHDFNNAEDTGFEAAGMKAGSNDVMMHNLD